MGEVPSFTTKSFARFIGFLRAYARSDLSARSLDFTELHVAAILESICLLCGDTS